VLTEAVQQLVVGVARLEIVERVAAETSDDKDSRVFSRSPGAGENGGISGAVQHDGAVKGFHGMGFCWTGLRRSSLLEERREQKQQKKDVAHRKEVNKQPGLRFG
jgi:hypothetical protein